VARHDYRPFGEELIAGDGFRGAEWGKYDGVKQKFTGQEHDGETEFDFFHARYLSGAQQRFMSADPGNAGADPMNPQSWNAYAYVNNNPMNATDPTGLETWNVGPCYFNTAYSYVDGQYQGSSTNFIGCFPNLTDRRLQDAQQESPPLPPQRVHVEEPPSSGSTQPTSLLNIDVKNLLRRAGTAICGSQRSTGEQVFRSVRKGAAKGLVGGALNGAGAPAIPLLIPNIMGGLELGAEAGVVGGPVGVISGALIGGATGAASGVLIGVATSAVCTAAGF
jgi:RHS repeat-associated protein